MIAALVAAGTTAQAQRVRGTLTDSATREPVSGAVVTLSDSTGRFLSRALADDKGQYAVPRVGRPTHLRVLRIGYRPRDLALAADDSVIDVRMAPIVSVLAAVSSSAKRVCPGEDANAAALDLWEQVRAGLLAGVVAREQGAPRVRLRTFVRSMEPIRGRVQWDSSTTKELVLDRSFVAARPAWAFELEGYMREQFAGEREYFAPDDAVLLDPSFAATHCLRTVVEDSARGGRLGIGFDPIDARGRDTLVDITGVIWLDARHRGLSSLDYHYTNLERDARESGGVIEFTTMPNGVPMITRWVIRSVELAIDAPPNPTGIQRSLPPRPLRTGVRVLGHRESGGAVISAEWPGGATWHGDFPRLVGQVNDMKQQPMPGVRVWLRDTKDTVTTRADGSFEFPYLYPGFYVLDASDSALATQGVSRIVPMRVPLLQGGDAAYAITMHPRRDVFQLLCPANSYKPGTGVLIAQILHEDGTPAANANVDAVAEQIIIASDTITRPQVRTGKAGADGRFTICGAAMDLPLVVRASLGGAAAVAAVDTWKDELVSLRLVLKPKP